MSECVHKKLGSSHIADFDDKYTVCTQIVYIAKENTFELRDEDGVEEMISTQNEDMIGSALIDVNTDLVYKEKQIENLVEFLNQKFLLQTN